MDRLMRQFMAILDTLTELMDGELTKLLLMELKAIFQKITEDYYLMEKKYNSLLNAYKNLEDQFGDQRRELIEAIKKEAAEAKPPSPRLHMCLSSRLDKFTCDQKIMAIKAYRAICHEVGLKDAKEAIEYMMEYHQESQVIRTRWQPVVLLSTYNSLKFQEAIRILEQWWDVEFTTR